MGDAIVQMVLAHNLSRQGFVVTLFSDIGSQLNDLVSLYSIKAFPSYDELLHVLNSFNITLYDSSSRYVRGMPKVIENWCAKNAICYRLSDALPRHRSISEQTIANRLSESHKHNALKLKSLNATLRSKPAISYRLPIVEQLTQYLKERACFDNVSIQNGLSVIVKERDRSKIIIHPTSSKESKNWPARKYIELIKHLKKIGYTPVVTVMPKEREKWLYHSTGLYDLPIFNSLKELANYYADAGVLIGNDSGNAHLASYLGVPTLQIFRGRKKYPAWRAGWAENDVVIADIPYCLSKRHWQNGVSVKKVINRFHQLKY